MYQSTLSCPILSYLTLSYPVRRIQQELRDQHGLVGSRGMTLTKRILQLGIVSNLMGYSTGENSLDEALSLEESPIFMSENQFWIIFDIVMFSGFVIFLLCVCYTFCMYARGYRLYKRSVCEDRSTQTVDVRVASSLRFEEELTVERSSASSDLFADRTVVWVTSGGRCYHKPGCKWTLHGYIEMTESAAILANYKVCQTCHSFGKGRGKAPSGVSGGVLRRRRVRRPLLSLEDPFEIRFSHAS